MKVFVDAPEHLSRAMGRVSKALRQYAPPGVNVVATENVADIVILHVVGYPDTVEAVERLRSEGKAYGLIQYCLRSTQRPDTASWLELWKDAEIVWSYYDLEGLMKEDGQFVGQTALSRFYMSPLGVDSTVFRPWPTPKTFKILTSGYIAESEGVLEAMEAAKRVGGKVFHLGPDDKRYGDHVHQRLDINDPLLAQSYSLCEYVAGLRRCEGFELPAAEGLLCGARPIMFDQPHYRRWFQGFAEFIPEGSFDEVTNSIEQVFKRPVLVPVSLEERAEAMQRFSWENIVHGFWNTITTPRPKLVQETSTVTLKSGSKPKRRLLWIGDAVVSSGFARATHHILNVVKEEWNVAVLGVNYFGDPHPYPYPIYPTRTLLGGDLFGVERIAELVKKERADLIVIQNDPWNFPPYIKACGNMPVVGVVAVDGMNCRGRGLNGLKLGVFWTEFGLEEARAGGYSGLGVVIPLGVDREVYKPMDQREARMTLPFSPEDKERLADSFIIGAVGRNQPRKRFDLLISFFADWIRSHDIRDAYLFIHTAPTGDVGYDLAQLAQYYGINNRLIVVEPDIGHGVTQHRLAQTYASFDLLATTTQGEGWGLPVIEAMACGIPVIGPAWAALGEWPGEAMYRVPCAEIACTISNINAIGGVPSRTAFLEGLNALYNPETRQHYSERGLALVKDPRFDWNHIGGQYLQALDIAMKPALQRQEEMMAT